jgi:hypothetical protein
LTCECELVLRRGEYGDRGVTKDDKGRWFYQYWMQGRQDPTPWPHNNYWKSQTFAMRDARTSSYPPRCSEPPLPLPKLGLLTSFLFASGASFRSERMHGGPNAGAAVLHQVVHVLQFAEPAGVRGGVSQQQQRVVESHISRLRRPVQGRHGSELHPRLRGSRRYPVVSGRRQQGMGLLEGTARRLHNRTLSRLGCGRIELPTNRRDVAHCGVDRLSWTATAASPF